MALPSIILLLSFVGGVFVSIVTLLELSRPVHHLPDYWAISAPALAAAAAYLHWLRYKVPITVAAGTLCGIATVYMLLLANMTFLREWAMPMVFVGGLVAFVLAMHWDSSDRSRISRRADVAFWLHLAAAPLVVHPVFYMLGLLDRGEVSLFRAVTAMGIYVVLAVIAIAVDRRALLVSALFYVLVAMTILLQKAGAVSGGFALTSLVIGSALLLLSAAWHRVRVVVVGCLPLAIQSRLPLV